MSGTYPDAELRRRTVLVAVVNNPEDLARAATEGWYRIPQRRAPKRIGADYLAFYQTSSFTAQEEAQTVTYFAATRRYRLVTRRELLPDEADHPRANDYYYRVDVGPLQRLPRPVPARTYRRITFIHTTLACLLAADDVRDLFQRTDPFEQLWSALREHNLRPLKNRIAGDRPVDIALRARHGYLGINCTEGAVAHEAGMLPSERWSLLQLPSAQIEQDLEGCLRRIGAALIALGGSVLNAPDPVGR